MTFGWTRGPLRMDLVERWWTFADASHLLDVKRFMITGCAVAAYDSSLAPTLNRCHQPKPMTTRDLWRTSNAHQTPIQRCAPEDVWQILLVRKKVLHTVRPRTECLRMVTNAQKQHMGHQQCQRSGEKRSFSEAKRSGSTALLFAIIVEKSVKFLAPTTQMKRNFI